MKTLDRSALAAMEQQINCHPALSETDADRQKNGRENYIDLCNLLMKYFRFDQQLAAQTALVSGTSTDKKLSIQDAEERLLKGKKTTFDGPAFMEAYLAAINGYIPDVGSFTAYFYKLYVQRLNRAIDEQYQTAQRRSLSMGEKKARQIKNLLTLLRSTGQQDPARLPQALYPEYAKRLNVSEPVFRELIQLVLQMDAVPNVPVQDDEGDDMPDLLEGASDSAARKDLLREETVDTLCAMLELLTDIDEREYPRLFLTNALIKPLKEDSISESARIPYAQAMVRQEDLLWQRILILSYLEFVFSAPPVPDSVRNIVLCSLNRPLMDKTIAEYKQVSASAVSQNSKRFWAKMKSDKLQRVLELLQEM